MRYATPKDIDRAATLGEHKGATHSSKWAIARGKASTMANAITDKKKILGRLEAVADKWNNDSTILEPFIHKCLNLYPEGMYRGAYALGEKYGNYATKLYYSKLVRDNIGGYPIAKKAGKLKNLKGRLVTGVEYDYDEIALIIFNYGYDKGF